MNKSRQLIFASLGALALIAGGALWNQSRLVTRVEIRQQSVGSNGKTAVSRWQWQGAQAQNVFDQLAVKSDGCNICVNPTPPAELLTLTVSRRFGGSSQQKINLQSGQITPYQQGCLSQLTPQSLKYLQDVVAQTPNGN